MGSLRVRNPYQRIAADLRAAITCGAFRTGDHLPTVEELATRYDVAPGTALSVGVASVL